jgi:hypothetical protein
MTNWKLLTGCFAGSVIEEGKILDVPFNELDDDLQLRIRDWADSKLSIIDDGENWAVPGGSDKPISLEDIKEQYEHSWESEETDEPVDLIPVSQWKD